MSVYVFGYGSLINKDELSEELHKKKRVTPVIVSGLKRSFNVSSSGGKYKVLGVKDTNKTWCNGVLFKVNVKELEKLIERENKYIVKAIEQNRISFDYGKKVDFKKEDQVLCFYPKPLYILNKKKSTSRHIRPHYETICLEGAAELGEDFLQDFSETN